MTDRPDPSLLVLYPGSFDPIHLGHVDVIEQALELFGSVAVAVMHNPAKPSGMFTLDERMELIRASVAHLPEVEVESFAGLVVDAAKAFGADFLVKGLRTAGDFEIEQQMAQTNHAVAGVRTVFLPCAPNPTTGFFFYVPKSKIIEVDMSTEDAATLIMSAGVVQPGSAPDPKKAAALAGMANAARIANASAALQPQPAKVE
jgi:pantetheine-phosphate adenylyltransferase